MVSCFKIIIFIMFEIVKSVRILDAQCLQNWLNFCVWLQKIGNLTKRDYSCMYERDILKFNSCFVPNLFDHNSDRKMFIRSIQSIPNISAQSTTNKMFHSKFVLSNFVSLMLAFICALLLEQQRCCLPMHLFLGFPSGKIALE